MDDDSTLAPGSGSTYAWSGISSVWGGAPAAPRKRRQGSHNSEGWDNRLYACNDEVQAQAWVPGLLLALLHRAQLAHGKLQEDIAKAEDAIAGKASANAYVDCDWSKCGRGWNSERRREAQQRPQ